MTRLALHTGNPGGSVVMVREIQACVDDLLNVVAKSGLVERCGNVICKENTYTAYVREEPFYQFLLPEQQTAENGRHPLTSGKLHKTVFYRSLS